MGADDFFALLQTNVADRRKRNPAYDGDMRGRFDVLGPVPRSWVLDLHREAAQAVIEVAPDSAGSMPTPDFTLTCESEAVLLEALKGKREFTAAMAKRQLRVQGNFAKLGKLKDVFEPAPEGSEDGDGEDNQTPMLVPVPKSQWEPDGPQCSQCGAGFSLITRRHHCRFCGALCCADCTRFRLSYKQKRACMLCHLAVQRARREYEENGGSGGMGNGVDGAAPLSPTGGAYGPDYGQDMTERMLTLESRLGSLERARRVKKARTLLKCADWVIRSATASMLFSGGFVGHYLALFVQLRGWDVRGMELLQPGLGAVVEWLEPSSSSSWTGQLLAAPLAYLKQLYEQHPTSIDSYWFVMVLTVLATLLLVSSTLYRRSTTAFSVAAVLVVAIELTKVRVGTRLAAESEAVWEEANYIYGAYLRLAFFRLKGSYIKMAQYISSRADIVPDAFSDELSALQDAVPPSPLAAVRPIIERALGAKLDEAFYSFESEALASASIAQVHRATLKDGTEVVVKVQHPDVAQLLSIDLKNIVVILTAIGWIEPDYDFSMVAHEWSKEVRKELDFNLEGENLRMAYEGIVHKSGLDAVVPRVLHASPDVLVMTYCEGIKVTDPRAFPDPETAAEDKAMFMKTLCEVFAYGCYVEGFFQGDPHAGNIHVQAHVNAEGHRHCRPVVLDWGLAKKLSEHVRVGNAKIVLSVWELDMGGMLDGMEEVGMPIDLINVVEDLGNIRFMMRNTSPGAEAREQSKQFMDDFVEKSKHKPKSERNPLKTMVPELLFLARVTEMLQGLGAKLGVRVEYMHIMAASCKRALLERPGPSLSLSSGYLSPPPALSFLDRKVRILLQDLLAEGHGVGAQVVLYKNGRMLVNAAEGLRSRLDPGRVTPATLFCGFSLTKAVLAILAHALVDDNVLRYDTLLVDVCPELKGTGKDSVTLRQILTHSAGLQYAFPDKATPQSLWNPQTGTETIKEARPVGGKAAGRKAGTRLAMHYYSFGWLLVPLLERASGKSLAQLVHEKLLVPLGLQPDNDTDLSGIILGPVPGTTELASSDDPRLATVEYDLRQLVAEMSGGADGDIGANMGGGLMDMVEGMMNFGEGEGAAEEAAAFKELARTKLAGREFLLDHRMLNGKRCRASGALPSLSGRFTARALADILESLCRLERSSGNFAQQQFLTTTTTSPLTSASASSSGSFSGSPSETTTTIYLNGGGNGGGGVAYNKSASSLAATPAGLSPGTAPFSILSLARLQDMKSNPVDDEPGLTRLMGRENTIKLGCGVQLFGFEAPMAGMSMTAGEAGAAAASNVTSRTVRWGSAYGHAGACGQLALCDPSTGVVLVVTSNKAATPGQKNVGYEVLSLVAEELNLGKPLPFW